MTDPAASAVSIPQEIRDKFPDLVPLILGSESMNDEERQYWVNILLIMTPEQVENLKGILENEKQQLADIEQKYSGTTAAVHDREALERTEEERRSRREERTRKEERSEQQEDEKAEDLLNQIEEL